MKSKMENILTFDEYNDFSLSEGLFTIDFIYLLMEEEHRLGLDNGHEHHHATVF